VPASASSPLLAVTVGPAALRCAVVKYKQTLKVHRQYGGLESILLQQKSEIRKAANEVHR
jgi:hypothetical protein